MVWILKISPKLCASPQFNFYISLLTPVFRDCHMLRHVKTVQSVFSVVRGKHEPPSRFLSSRNVFWANVRCHLNSHIKVMQRSLGSPPISPRVRVLCNRISSWPSSSWCWVFSAWVCPPSTPELGTWKMQWERLGSEGVTHCSAIVRPLNVKYVSPQRSRMVRWWKAREWDRRDVSNPGMAWACMWGDWWDC